MPESRPQTTTTLTPQFCFNTTALRDFMRLSRGSIDDSISAHLNSLLQPSRSNPFRPSSTDTQAIQTPSIRGHQEVPSNACTHFRHEVLYPCWKSRDDVLTYCSQVAEGKAELLRGVEVQSVESTTESGSTVLAARVLHNPWGAPQQTDERIDPYSARDYSYTRAGQEQVLREVLDQEEGVERVIKARTWGVLRDRCVGGSEVSTDGWKSEYSAWQARVSSR